MYNSLNMCDRSRPALLLSPLASAVSRTEHNTMCICVVLNVVLVVVGIHYSSQTERVVAVRIGFASPTTYNAMPALLRVAPGRFTRARAAHKRRHAHVHESSPCMFACIYSICYSICARIFMLMPLCYRICAAARRRRPASHVHNVPSLLCG